ncbi:MotA/TolQ/ExbB proton channel family protein [Methanosarcina mazei]|uniref:Flagellar motor protein MotA n=7 Tax=Methanosarcina mazei TaxID=2209 RepID=A0A0F8J2Q9_METMZ|nr:MotA/TolQ/ExbB proton channel family protein [Methanosarcina mazei]AGF97020.1 putative transporter PduT for various metalloporphyrins [Methanosarcina mazei Tuc01]AKB41984.1 putative transporter PduT for various metalloporphyrins [Methanosarcina mazei WWM610]AKB66268.1 putative transporter PduT for various metalloporphyrins [Methanosarcina mazei S-6]AKB69610.1 putative transporter PduT for various metalloporphyrins [Methanosarcina mazei LYC]AKB72981.1 putative transporter PduT for various me
MSMMNLLSSMMNVFSTALLIPVMFLLSLLVFLSLIQLGEFLSEYTKRHRDWNNLEANCKKLENDLRNSDFTEASRALENIKQNYMVTSFARDASKYLKEKHLPAIERLSQEYEIQMAKRLEHTKITSTIGPMLGLMGTLIPLGPALIGLSAGDLETLAQNLMIAFATTVVGLFAAGIGYVLTQVRRRWYWEDMSDIDYILDTIEEKI